MMPTVPFHFLNDGVAGPIANLSLAFPFGLELAALVPVGFAVGLLAVLFQAIHANRRAERRARLATLARNTA